METAYRNWERHHARPRSGAAGRKAKVTLGVRERRRLIQLGVCIVLFLVVFVGKGMFPEQMGNLRENLTQIMGSDTDFRAAFAGLGRSISKGEPVLDTLGDLWIEVFGGTQTTPPAAVKQLPSYEAERTFLNGHVTVDALMERRLLGGVEAPEQEPAQPQNTETAPPEETAPPVEVAEPAEPAVVHMDYSGPALPANATMDKYALGLETTVSPVDDWWLSSAFGWRIHPVDGEEKFHNGIDMAVNDGTVVHAFASGTVDYIGESPIYGLYTQIKHDNGVTTFYCHCSELLVQQGQKVTVGDKIAMSGETGNALGPHLHFEIKKDGMLLNPIYYVSPE